MSFLSRLTKLNERMARGTKYEEIELSITGASLPSGTATNAAFSSGLGKEIAVASDAGGSTVTITFNEDLPGTPIVKSFRVNSTVTANVTSLSASSIVYTTSSADQNVYITLKVPTPSEY